MKWVGVAWCKLRWSTAFHILLSVRLEADPHSSPMLKDTSERWRSTLSCMHWRVHWRCFFNSCKMIVCWWRSSVTVVPERGVCRNPKWMVVDDHKAQWRVMCLWPGPTQIDMGMGRLCLTMARIGLDRYRPRPTLIDMDAGRLELTSSWIDMDLGWLDSTLAWDDSDRHGPSPNRINMGQGRLYSTLARVYSDRHRPESTEINMDATLLRSTLTWANSAWHGFEPTWLNMGLKRLGPWFTWFDFGMGPMLTRGTSPLSSTRVRVDSTWLWLGPSWLDLGQDRLGSTMCHTDSG